MDEKLPPFCRKEVHSTARKNMQHNTLWKQHNAVVQHTTFWMQHNAFYSYDDGHEWT
jgi:hypothetical protein